MMATDLWKLVFDVAQFVLTALLGLVVWLLRQDQASRTAVRALEDQLDERLDHVEINLVALKSATAASPQRVECGEHIRRISVVEEAIRHLPTHDDLGRTHARIDAMADLIARVDGKLTGIDHNVQLLLENSLSQSDRGHS